MCLKVSISLLIASVFRGGVFYLVCRLARNLCQMLFTETDRKAIAVCWLICNQRIFLITLLRIVMAFRAVILEHLKPFCLVLSVVVCDLTKSCNFSYIEFLYLQKPTSQTHIFISASICVDYVLANERPIKKKFSKYLKKSFCLLTWW